MITARCRICGFEVTVEEPAGFAEYCEASSAARNVRISAELALRNARRWRHDAPGATVTNAVGFVVKPALAPLQKSTPDDVRKAWISTLCHQSCYKRRDKRKALEERITKAVLHKRDNPGEWAEGSKLYRALDGICREWCKLVARDMGYTTSVYWPEFVAALLEFPREVATVMSSARDFIRSQMKLQQPELIEESQ